MSKLRFIITTGIFIQFIIFILGSEQKTQMDDCFRFFAPILNGVAFEFSKCYMNCSKDSKNTLHTKDDVEEKDIEKQNYEVEKCQNASIRGYVENYYLTFLELQDCIMSTTDTNHQQESEIKQNSSNTNEGETLIEDNKETQKNKIMYSGYQRRKICDID
ncbi:uncharacterized protein LOC129952034 [Eupeodes corollae]|uniref:uncharacterized protein LOC129952034 n=1 Tax=Eupeodes corollae TaxID=290404 RepID=UPI00249231F1|nr:uncharacterized protein LOC129952034 [Eupeodes corollae]